VSLCILKKKILNKTYKGKKKVIVSGTPKREIQEKVKAFAHASANILERETASIHLDVRSMMVKNIIKITTIL
jgi:hypothetical protein